MQTSQFESTKFDLGIDIHWDEHNTIENYISIQELLQKQIIQKQLKKLWFHKSSPTKFGELLGLPVTKYDVFDLLFRPKEIQEIRSQSWDQITKIQQYAKTNERKIPPDAKWSKISNAKQLSNAITDLDDKNKNRKDTFVYADVGWRVTFPYEAIIPVHVLMASNNLQKVLLHYPNRIVARCCAKSDDHNNLMNEDFEKLKRGWHKLPNENLYPITMVTDDMNNSNDWDGLTRHGYNLDRITVLNRSDDPLENGTIVDMSEILARLDKLEVFDICLHNVEHAHDIICVLGMIQQYLELMTQQKKENELNRIKLNICLRIRMTVCSHSVFFGDYLHLICKYIGIIMRHGTAIDIQITETCKGSIATKKAMVQRNINRLKSTNQPKFNLKFNSQDKTCTLTLNTGDCDTF